MKCSIICNTFNHEHVIRRAIDGFLMQKTNFEIEILIHDDASTDTTQQIISQYKETYPSLIKPIFQKENQTSKGQSVTQINIARALGEYIAICEGDDVWIDPNKLQKQIDFLDNHPEFNCIGHACLVKNINFPNKSKVWSIKDYNTQLTTEEIIQNRGIVFAHNTFVFRRNIKQYPDFFNDFKVADVKRVIFSSLNGSVYFLNEVMSIYQVGIKGSWTERVRLNNEKIIEHYTNEIEFYQKLNNYTNNRYSRVIENVIEKLIYQISILKREFKVMKSSLFRNSSLYHKVSICFELIFPSVFNKLRRLRFKYWV